jgi:hypothetical protein
MQVQAHLTNTKVIDHFSKMPEKLDLLVKQGVQNVSKQALREITGKEGLSKYGRHKKGTPTTSPAGEPPAQMTTMLRRSVTIMPMRRIGFGHYTQETMPTMVYARVQELGDLSRGIPARPYIAPARNRLVMSGRAKEIFAQGIKKEMNRHG